MRIGKRTLVGAGIFAALVGVEVYLARSMAVVPSIRGYVDTRSYSVAAPAKGRLLALDVTLGQRVTAGQLIAEMDSSAVDAELASAMAQRKQLLAAGVGTGTGTGTGTGSGSGATDIDLGALQTLDAQLEVLAERRDSLRLVAPADGMIEALGAAPGDVLSAATTVATVVAADTRSVIACVPENRLAEATVGRVADVSVPGAGVALTGVVQSITPSVAALPERCQPAFARIPVLGRIAVIMLDGTSNQLLPGQTELVAFRGAVRSLPAPVPPVRASAGPQPISVPPELAAVSRIEASGLVWVAALDRYVVVSDETGLGDRHPPWLFTLSRGGILDPEPMTIANLDELDDVESIAQDDHAQLFLLASQSVSAHGKRPAARQALVRLVRDGAGYRADAHVALASLLDAAPAATRAALGLADTAALDIEGLAWRGGALYLGVKAPLDEQGLAMIWKVGAPEQLLAGNLAAAAIERFGSVPLALEMDGQPAHGGIADLLFLDDTTLLLGATLSGASGKHQAGAIYLATRTAAGWTPTLLRTVPDGRPEGLAETPDLAQIAVVFDRGHDPPTWLRFDRPSPARPAVP